MKIDPNKFYTTKSGHRVIGIHIIEKNAAGRKVTFPVKGSIVMNEKTGKKTYQIWTMDGRVDPVWNENSHEDLIEVSKKRYFDIKNNEI